jgi:hypothetical protein
MAARAPRRLRSIAAGLRCGTTPAASAEDAAAAAAAVGERRIASGKLHAAICAVLDACGTDAEVQEIVATHLIEANLRGHDSHGIQMISKYMKAYQNGQSAQTAQRCCSLWLT